MKRLLIIVIIGISFFLSSCITIFEKYSINSDGSGTMEYLVDMSRVYSIMESLSDGEGIEELDLKETFLVAIPELNILKGVSNAEIAGQPEKYIFGIKFNFSDADALNSALRFLFEDDKNSSTVFVEMKRNKFIRNHATSDEFSRESILDEGEEVDESVINEILQEMRYNISLDFEKDIKRIKSKAEYEQTDDRSLTIHANFNQLLDDDEYLKTIVRTR